jgi:integrase
VYVKEQMGHSSIQVTVDIYGHLIPGANVSFVDRLDKASEQEEKTTSRQNATQAQGPERSESEIPVELVDERPDT